jgi:actin-like ATPase involved in cell morphogenesis
MTLIGIDLGARYCRVATASPGQLRLLPDATGETATPSWIAVTPAGQVAVGHAAARAAREARVPLLVDLKCRLADHLPLQFGDTQVAPAEVLAHLLRALRRDAESSLGSPVSGAVLTVPARAGMVHRAALRRAAELAGLTEVRLADEPFAAALDYHGRAGGDRRVLIYSLGAGHFETSLVEITGRRFDTLAALGEPGIAGDAFDRALRGRLIRQVDASGINAADPRIRHDLLLEAEQAKIALATNPTYTVRVAARAAGYGEPRRVEATLTRTDLDEVVKQAVDQTIDLVKQLLATVRVPADDVDDVLLVGGSAGLPGVTERLRGLLGKEPVRLDLGAVALGAALYGESVLSGRTSGDARHPAAGVDRPNETVRGAPSPASPTALAPSSSATPTPHPTAETVDAAYELLFEGRESEAIAIGRRLVATGDDGPGTRLLLAEAYFRLAARAQEHEAGKAIALLKTGLPFDGEDGRLRRRLAELYRRRAEQLVSQGSLRELRALVVSASENDLAKGWADDALCGCLIGEGLRLRSALKPREALEHFLEAVDHCPDNEVARRQIGLVSTQLVEGLLAKRDTAQALRRAQIGLRFDRDNPDLVRLQDTARARSKTLGARARAKRRGR